MRKTQIERTENRDELGGFVTKILRDNGKVTGGRQYIACANTPEAEERHILGQSPLVSSPVFDRNRGPVMEDLRAIMDDTFKRYEISAKNGLDIGSGATGTMVNRLLPANTSAWIQSDLNPASNVMNRASNSSARVADVSMFGLVDRFGPKKFDTVTGLSSIDGTIHLAEVMNQVSGVLKDGGHFVHFQDVRPGFSPLVSYLNELGLQGPYLTESLVGAGNSMDLASIHLPNEGFVGVGEIFRRRVQQVLEASSDLEILYNGWVEARSKVVEEARITRAYHMNILLTLQSDSLPAGNFASGVVTVARKRG